MKNLTLEDRWAIEGLTELNETFRHYVEAGYDLDFVEADNQATDLQAEIDDLEEQMKLLRKEINSGSCPKERKHMLQEEHRELRDEFVSSFLSLKFLEWRLLQMTGRYPVDPLPGKKDFEVGEENEYVSSFHWQCAHDVAQRRHEELEQFLKRSNELQDRKVLRRIEKLRGRKELSAWWYYRLSTLVVKKHVRKEDFNWFLRMTKEAKKKARRLERWFWAATADRLINFRKKCEASAEENGRAWGPKEPGPLDNLHMSFDDRWDYGRSLTEDQIISVLDIGKE